MLVLTRKVGEKILIGGNIVVTVIETSHGKVRLGIDAPSAVRILREELQSKYTTPRDLDENDRDLAAKPREWRSSASSVIVPALR